MPTKGSGEDTPLLLGSYRDEIEGLGTSTTPDTMGRGEGEEQTTAPMDVRGGNRMSKLHDAEYRRKFMRSIWMSLSMFARGLVMGQMGPAFMDLQLLTHTSIQQASFFLTIGPAGDMVGAVISGFIYDHLSQTLLPVSSLQGMGLIFLAMPFCSGYWAMVTACFLLFLCRQTVTLVATADIFRLWGTQGTSFLHAIHFAVAAGAVVAPLITEPFLAPRSYTNQSAPSRKGNHTSDLNLNVPDYDLDLVAGSETGTRIRFAFFISSAVCFLISLPLVVDLVRGCFESANRGGGCQFKAKVENVKRFGRVLCFKARAQDDRVSQNSLALGEPGDTAAGISRCERQTKTPLLVPASPPSPPSSSPSSSSSATLSLPTASYFGVVTWIMLFYFVFVGTRLTAWSYLPSFAVLHMDWTKSQGVFLEFAFWVSVAVGRLASVFLANCWTSTALLAISFGVCVPALVALILASLCQLDWAVWLCTALCGLSSAPMYANSASWINASLVPISGKLTCCIDLACNAGLLATLAVQGVLIGSRGAIWFVYVMLVEAVLSCLIWLSLFLCFRFYLQPKYGVDCQRRLDVTAPCNSSDVVSNQPSNYTETEKI